MLLTGCKPPPDAPQELDALVGYLYENAAADDPAALEAGVTNTSLWLDAHLAETIEGYTVDNLSQEAVDALDDGPRDLSGLVGAAVGHESPHAAEEVGITAASVEQDVWYPEAYSAYAREYHTDPDCFFARTCESMEYETHATSSYAMGLTVDTNAYVQFRWVETEAGTALVQRSWLHSPAVVNLDWLDVEEQFYLWVFLPRASGSRSIQATWIVAEISGGSVPEGLALSLVVDSMAKAADTLDGFIAGRE